MSDKKIFPLLIGFIFLFLLTNPALAKEGTSNDKVIIKTKSETRVINRATASANSAREGEKKREIRQEVKERINEKTQARLHNLSKIFSKKLDHLVDRLNLIIKRIESRLSKIKQRDEAVDIVEIEAVLENAKRDLNLVEEKITSLKVQLDDLTQFEDDPFRDVKELKNSFKEIKDLLLNVRKDLVKTIGLMKGLRLGK